MASMEDILSTLLNSEGVKTASAEPEVSSNENDVITKVAADISDDELSQLEKLAEEHEAEKTAEEAIAYGRFMAHGFYEQLSKIAADDTSVSSGSMNNVSGTVGSTDIAHGGGGKQMSEGGRVDDQAAKDPSTVLTNVKSKLDALSAPASPNAKEEGFEVVQKIIAAAKEHKQQAAEMPNNG
jgi:hypothetical protein